MSKDNYKRFILIALMISFGAVLVFIHLEEHASMKTSKEIEVMYTQMSLDKKLVLDTFSDNAISLMKKAAIDHLGANLFDVNSANLLYSTMTIDSRSEFSNAVTQIKDDLYQKIANYDFIKIALLLVKLCLTLLLAHQIRREHYQAKILSIEGNNSKLSDQLKEKERLSQTLIKKYQSTKNAYMKAVEKENELKSKIDEADVIQKEMKDFVDIQIKTNEQLMIAETKLKNLLEKEQEGKAILNQTLERLKDTQGQLVHSEKMASLGQLTAGIAHEINNPINFVYNGIESLKRNMFDLNELLEKYQELNAETDLKTFVQEVAEIKEDIDYNAVMEDLSELFVDVKEGANRTIEIVKGLRVFSRLDEENQKKADINECLEATLVLLKNKTKNRITVTKDYNADIPEIMCYPGQLNQVFMNILNNAIQAIPDDKADAEIKVTTSLHDDGVMVKLADNGSGMSDEVKNRIFEPFFTTKPVGVGTGLGMSISFGIIEKHHGNITVESTKGVGTEFSIYLPNKINLAALEPETKTYSKAG